MLITMKSEDRALWLVYRVINPTKHLKQSKQDTLERLFLRRTSCIQTSLKRLCVFQECVVSNKSGNLRHQLLDTGTLLHFSNTVLNISDITEWNDWLQSSLECLCFLYVSENNLSSNKCSILTVVQEVQLSVFNHNTLPSSECHSWKVLQPVNQKENCYSFRKVSLVSNI